jgi:hypothetical protein
MYASSAHFSFSAWPPSTYGDVKHVRFFSALFAISVVRAPSRRIVHGSDKYRCTALS